MAKKEIQMNEGYGLIEKVGYNPNNFTSFVCKGMSTEILGSKFVVVVKEGEYAQYQDHYQEFVGKLVKFKYKSLSDVNVPQGNVFVDVE